MERQRSVKYGAINLKTYAQLHFLIINNVGEMEVPVLTLVLRSWSSSRGYSTLHGLDRPQKPAAPSMATNAPSSARRPTAILSLLFFPPVAYHRCIR